MENENLDLAYKSERIDILLRAKQLIIQWMYYNALGKEYDIRLQNARQIASSYQKRFDIGDANILENNKAQINLTNVENERKKIEIEQNLLFSQLKALNGGQAADVSLMDFPLLPMSLSFEDWYAGAELKSPLLQYISKQREIAQQQVKLNNALALPKFTTGYMSEKVVGEHFQGITLGISIPLWENKNKVRQAKAQVRVAELELEDNRLQFYNHLQGLHVQAAELQRNVVKYKRALADHNNEPFLKKALDAGEISLLTYLLEIEYYYDAVEKTLEAEKDYNLAVAELSAIEL